MNPSPGSSGRLQIDSGFPLATVFQPWKLPASFSTLTMATGFLGVRSNLGLACSARASQELRRCWMSRTCRVKSGARSVEAVALIVPSILGSLRGPCAGSGGDKVALNTTAASPARNLPPTGLFFMTISR